MNSEKIEEIIKFLEEQKLKSIEAFDLRGKSRLARFIIVATGPNEKSLKACAVKTKEFLFGLTGEEAKLEGEFPGDWIIVDSKDYIIELFTEEKRKYYNLEKLWGDSKNKLQIALKAKKKS